MIQRTTRLSLIVILTTILNSSIPLPGFTDQSSRPTSPKVTIPAGSRIVLRSEEPVGTRSHRAGNRINLHMARDLHLKNGIVLTRAQARATVIRSHRRRRLTFVDRPELHLRVDELVFPDAPAVAVTSRIVRINRLPLQAREHGIVKLEGNRSRAYLSGMINGALFGGPLGAAIGTGAGLLISRKRDLLLHEGTYFEIELVEALELPSSVRGTVAAVSMPAIRKRFFSNPEESPLTTTVLPTPGPDLEISKKTSSRSPTPLSPFSFKVDVDLVTVPVTVLDYTGRVRDDLGLQNFRVFEDGIEQAVTHFGRDGLPLSVALIVDGSGSVAPYLGELQNAAMQSLDQLAPDDRVALFSFDRHVHHLVELTSNFDEIADRLSTILPRGNTNPFDAIAAGAAYLRDAAPDRRRAILLISDNHATTSGLFGGNGANRILLQTETVLYSVQTRGDQGGSTSRIAAAFSRMGEDPFWSSPESIAWISGNSGGEVLLMSETSSIAAALNTIIARLKLRYSLGYTPVRKETGGSYRRIEVKVEPSTGSRACDGCVVLARHGYYP